MSAGQEFRPDTSFSPQRKFFSEGTKCINKIFQSIRSEIEVGSNESSGGSWNLIVVPDNRNTDRGYKGMHKQLLLIQNRIHELKSPF